VILMARRREVIASRRSRGEWSAWRHSRKREGERIRECRESMVRDMSRDESGDRFATERSRGAPKGSVGRELDTLRTAAPCVHRKVVQTYTEDPVKASCT
jgi:hypothetical protein